MSVTLVQSPDEPAELGHSQIVADLRNLRSISQNRRYGGRRLPELPSRGDVITAVSGLIAILYPRHFGPPELTPDDIDGFITATLDTTLGLLTEQVVRELQLCSDGLGSTRAELERRALEITREFAERLPNVRALLDTDIRAAYAGDPAAKSLDEVLLCYPGVAAIMYHRLAHKLYLFGVPLLARMVSEIAHSQNGIDIHPGARIEESFFIDHGTGVVIGETAIIGRRVRLYQAVTLGAKRFELDERGALVKGGARHPILQDDVVIYAGATVLGRITVGHGSVIGGNVWLTHSVPPRSSITQARMHTETFCEGGGI